MNLNLTLEVFFFLRIKVAFANFLSIFHQINGEKPAEEQRFSLLTIQREMMDSRLRSHQSHQHFQSPEEGPVNGSTSGLLRPSRSGTPSSRQPRFSLWLPDYSKNKVFPGTMCCWKREKKHEVQPLPSTNVNCWLSFVKAETATLCCAEDVFTPQQTISFRMRRNECFPYLYQCLLKRQRDCSCINT